MSAKIDKCRNLTIFLRIFSKEKYKVNVSADMKVFELKDISEEKTGLPRYAKLLIEN